MADKVTEAKTASSPGDAVSEQVPGTAPESSVAPTLKVQLKKKEFFDRVVERSGVRKGEAKTAVEAALAVLGDALANGEEVNLPPLGKLKATRQKTTPRGMAYNLRLVRNLGDAAGTAPLADPDDDG